MLLKVLLYYDVGVVFSIVVEKKELIICGVVMIIRKMFFKKV